MDSALSASLTFVPNYVFSAMTSDYFRRSVSTSRRAFSVAAVIFGFAQSVFAGGAADQTHTLKFSVRDDQGQLIQSEQDVSGIVAFDPVTGALNTPVYDANAPAAPAGWAWSSTDLATGNQYATPQFLTWHNTTTKTNNVWDSFVQLKAAGNVDPVMTYSFSAKNNSAANQTYTFSYGESIVPTISGDYFVNADIAGSVTRGNLTQNAQITPKLSKIQTLRLSTDGGLTFLNAGVDVGTTHTSSFKTNPFGTDYAEAYGNLSGINYWQFDVSFILTPNKDAAALSGSAEIIAIPEPATYAGLMGGVTLLGAMMRRRRSAAV